MSTLEIVHGTLKPDGTLQLDQKPNLPPGQVVVTLQPVMTGPSSQRGLAEVIDEIHQAQLARSFQGRNAQEIEAGRRQGEAEYEKRLQEIVSQTNSSQNARGN